MKRVLVDRVGEQSACVDLDAGLFELDVADGDALGVVNPTNQVGGNRLVVERGVFDALDDRPVFVHCEDAILEHTDDGGVGVSGSQIGAFNRRCTVPVVTEVNLFDSGKHSSRNESNVKSDNRHGDMQYYNEVPRSAVV